MRRSSLRSPDHAGDAGNWKCNPASLSAALALADALNAAPAFPSNAQVVIAPTALHLSSVKDRLKRPEVEVAVQNVSQSFEA